MREFKNKIPRPDLDAGLIESLRQKGPWDIEIGAGQGLFAIRHAQLHPERRILAIERTHAKFAQLQRRRLAHPALSNLSCVQADAVAIFAHFVTDRSIDNIYLLYPNPYPKTKHANLRWANQPFTAALKKALRVGGTLTLATNLKWYAEEAAREFTGRWDFELGEQRLVVAPGRTHFEKKYLDRGETCFEMVFVKPNSKAE